jgi:hypothetical protein
LEDFARREDLLSTSLLEVDKSVSSLSLSFSSDEVVRLEAESLFITFSSDRFLYLRLFVVLLASDATSKPSSSRDSSKSRDFDLPGGLLPLLGSPCFLPLLNSHPISFNKSSVLRGADLSRRLVLLRDNAPGDRDRAKAPGDRDRVKAPDDRDRVNAPGDLDRFSALGDRARRDRAKGPGECNRLGDFSTERVTNVGESDALSDGGFSEVFERPSRVMDLSMDRSFSPSVDLDRCLRLAFSNPSVDRALRRSTDLSPRICRSVERSAREDFSVDRSERADLSMDRSERDDFSLRADFPDDRFSEPRSSLAISDILSVFSPVIEASEKLFSDGDGSFPVV